MPSQRPLALTAEFADDSTKQTQWDAFLRRGGLKTEAMTLREVIVALNDFLWPPVAAAATDTSFEAAWPPSGPWRHV